MTATVLVTGAAGYLGSVLVPRLLSCGYKVLALDNFMHGENSLAACCANPDFEVFRGDCRDDDVLLPLLRCADYIVPLAAIVGASACMADYTATWSTNYNAIGQLCSRASVQQRIVTPTTNSGYGIGAPGEMCTEESPLRPLTSYGKSKVLAEEVVLLRKNSISLRLATVFGASPRMRQDLLVNEFVLRALTDRAIVLFEGHFKRNFIHIADVANAFVHSIDNFEKMRGNAFNVGLSSANLSKIELCEVIKKHISDFTWVESPIGEDPDKRDYIVSNEKIEKTGWRPHKSLDDGIVELKKLFNTLKTRRYANA